MLDILSSPLRGYIAQNLQFYLSKYIEGIQLEGLGLFGGDLVLNDLEIKRHVLMESLEIPSSFDFSRGFIRELRIHIPWTQLLSQPIEVKLYTIELILTARSDAERRAQRTASSDLPPSSSANANLGIMLMPYGCDVPCECRSVQDPPAPEPKIEQPKSGWLHESLQKILANISIQVNNLVLKYEQDDIVLSVALGTLDFYSASAEKDWKRSFEEPQGPAQAICKRIDAKDLTIFLDRYTRGRSDSKTADVYRKVVGYEVPVLTRTSVSARAKILMKPRAVVPVPETNSNPAPVTSGAPEDGSVFDLPTRPSVVCDPFFLYSCNRSKIKPMYELDIFIGELTFSLSDRQLQMIAQLLRIASSRKETSSSDENESQTVPPLLTDLPSDKPSAKRVEPTIQVPDVVPSGPLVEAQAQDSKAPNSKESWIGWAMNVLGGSENGGEDDLESEIIAETKEALKRVNTTLAADAAAKAALKAQEGPFSLVSCLRLCIRTVSLTLRKHPQESQDNLNEADDSPVIVTEELVPVANLGLVRVPVQKTRSRVSRPATPLCTLRSHYVALEGISVQGDEKRSDLVFEIERVELLSATSASQDASDGKQGDAPIFQWGSVDTMTFANCVSHPYFISSFYGEESRHLNRRETRSFELVKVNFDTEIPVWKTMESTSDTEKEFDFQAPCECSIVWKGTSIPCSPTSTLYRVCQDVTRSIGLKERTMDGKALLFALTRASQAHAVSIQATEKLQEALGDITGEYQQLRSPDLGAVENMQQLLQPQLFALLARQTLHTCGAESLSSSCRSNDIRRRSVHSAVRLRVSLSRGSKNAVSSIKGTAAATPENDVPNRPLRVLDVSLGQADASLDPCRYNDVIELVSNFVSDVVKKDEKGERGELGPSDEETLGTQGAVSNFAQPADDTVLVTFSKLSVEVSNARKQFANLAVLARDVVYCGSNRDGTSVRKLLSVGELSASCTPPRGLQFAESVVQVVELELAVNDDMKGGDAQESGCKKKASLEVDRVMMKTNDESVFHGCVAADGLLSAVGGKSFLRDPVFGCTTRPRVFRLDVGSVRVSLSQTSSLRLESLNERVLVAEIGSLSVSSFVQRDPSRLCLEFHSGPNPFAAVGEQLFLSLSFSDQKTPGASCFVPLLPSFFVSEPNVRRSDQVPRYRLRVSAKIAKFEANLKGLVNGARGVSRIQQSLQKSRVYRQLEQRHEKKPSLRAPASTTPALRVPTNWGIVINFSSCEGLVHMNEFVDATIPAVAISSSPEESSSLAQSTAGGRARLTWSCGDLRVLMAAANKNGSALDERPIFVLQGLNGQVAYMHQVDKNQDQHHHTVEGDVHVSKVCANFSRLTLHYLLKLPSMRGSNRNVKSVRRIANGDENVVQRTSSSSISHQWSCKMGAQVDDISVKLCGDIRKTSTNSSSDTLIPILVEIDGRVTDASAAIRVGNHRPIKNAVHHTTDRVFRDFQVSVGDIGLHEVIHHRVRAEKTRFGDFSALSDHNLFGTLLCLDDSDLLSVMEAFRITTSQRPSALIPSPMLTWQLTNQIAKVFRTEVSSSGTSQCGPKRPSSSSKPAAIPLLTSWNRAKAQNNPRPSPLLAVFLRNYGESSDHQHIVATSVESIDVALTTSSLHCATALLDAFGGRKSASRIRIGADADGTLSYEDAATEASSADLPIATTAESVPNAATLDDIQLSLVAGQIRLILPSEGLSEALAMSHAVSPGNAMLMIDSTSVLSSTWNEISLDGLGYPPFNATKLPRRQRPPSQRLGESKLRLWCKIGKIHGAVVDFARTDIQESRVVDPPGPFEHFLSQQVEGAAIEVCASETFLLPFNVAVDIEEAGGGENKVPRRAALAITKLRLEVRKQDYDVVIGRISGALLALGALLQSSVLKAQKKSKRTSTLDPELDNKTAGSALIAASPNSQVVYAFASDGVEIALSNTTSSIHVRVGSMRILHNCSDGSGSFSVQNVVAGFRCAAGHSKNDGALATREELVFGAYSDPALWQLGADNYPEKLLAGRWSFLDHKERMIFLDMQAYQLHLSVHLLEQLKQFLRCSSSVVYSSRAFRTLSSAPRGDLVAERGQYTSRGKTAVKILIAPSVISLWERTDRNKTPESATCVWVTCGQTFANVGIGAEGWSHRHKLLTSSGDAVHELNRYFSVQETDFMLNLEKMGVKTSSDTPILEIEFRYGTVGSLPSHIASTWANFSRHLNSGSARFRFLEDCTIRVTGDINKVLEKRENSSNSDASKVLLATPLSRINLQGEVSAVDVKISSYSVESMVSLLGAVQPAKTEGSRKPSSSANQVSSGGDALPSQNDGVQKAPSSTDDFNYLRRVAEARHPAPGELVLTESLFIETGNSSDALSQTQQAKTLVQIDEIQFNNYEQIDEADLLSFIEEINSPWEVESPDPSPPDSSALPVFENKTMSWMGMRWCYHIPRVIDEIIANPVPIPPTGMPNGWPTWHGNANEESSSARLCDIFCQLRCWDYQSNRFVIISEFFIPWETSSNSRYRLDASALYEPESFGDFVTQWFEEDMEDYAYHAKLLELASATRRVRLQDAPPSDKWELRWRSPIFIDKEAEHKQKRLLVNALLASSIRINSTLATEAFQRAVVSVNTPRIGVSLCHISFMDYAHEVISVGFKDTAVSLSKYGEKNPELDVVVSTSLQVYVQNFAQLLNVSVLPRVGVHGMIHSSKEGLGVSTVVDPVALYLNHTTMLILSTMDKILAAKPQNLVSEPRRGEIAPTDLLLHDMRITLVNEAKRDIWYRQEGTSECLQVKAKSNATYSWLSLASNVYYRMEFALEKEEDAATPANIEHTSERNQELADDLYSVWSDPCAIKENCVTGRYFKDSGFLWVCVELKGLQTVVTLRPPIIFRNLCEFPIHLMLNDEKSAVFKCGQLNASPQEQGSSAKEEAPRSQSTRTPTESVDASLTSRHDENTSYIMADSVFRVRISRCASAWSSPLTVNEMPAEFDLVRPHNDPVRDDRKQTGSSYNTNSNNSARGSKEQFVILKADEGDGDPNGAYFFGWLQARRAACKSVLPNDFDPIQRQFAQRYAWMELTLLPALAIENNTDIGIQVVFKQKNSVVPVNAEALGGEMMVSSINPFEASEVEVLVRDTRLEQEDQAKWTFSLLCSHENRVDQFFDFGVLRFRVLMASKANGSHSPIIRIRVERGAIVQNLTDLTMDIRINCPVTKQQSSISVAASKEHQVGISSKERVVVLEVGVCPDPLYSGARSNDSTTTLQWSSQVRLSTEGDVKPCIISFQQAGAFSLAGSYLVELKKDDGGRIRISICPQVVVLNSTVYVFILLFLISVVAQNLTRSDDSLWWHHQGVKLKLLPTDSEGGSLMSEKEPAVISGDNAAWCTPVCLSNFKKRSLTSDVASWLSSTFSRRPSEDVDPSKVSQPAKLSCTFRVALDDDDSDWTEEITIKVPDLPLLITPSGVVEVAETRDAKHVHSGKADQTYVTPSTLTHRHRILVRQRGSKHRMLTYTVARVGNCIHVLFFVDHQSPVVIHNQWDHELGFRMMASRSFPEAVGAHHYMEYDWKLQARQSRSLPSLSETDSANVPAEAKQLKDWLASSSAQMIYSSNTYGDENEKIRFQIGSPAFGWSNTLWQVGGIQFATFSSLDSESAPTPTFLVMCSRRAGTWYISMTCLEDPFAKKPIAASGPPVSSALSSVRAISAAQEFVERRQRPRSLNICISVAELRFHCCDEFDPVRDARGLIQYPEIFRLCCSSATIVFSTSADPPESSRYNDRLGYLSHVRAYSTLLISIEDLELDHFLQDCNFPVILSFPGNEERHATREIMQLELTSKHAALKNVVSGLLDKQMPLTEENCLVGRVIFVDTWERELIPAYFHSIELTTLPAVLQVEDAILSYVHDFAQPLLDAMSGANIAQPRLPVRPAAMDSANKSSWVLVSYAAMKKTSQRRLYIGLLEFGTIEVTVTARVSIPILNSFDGTPVRFGSAQMCDVFAFPDQLYKDLAADYVADAIVRSPMLLMSLNILGNPAGFFRNVGTGVRDLFEIPLAAARDGYNPWTLTKGMIGGVSSFFGHTTAAALTSLSGFSYSISRTMDQLTLPSEQLKKRHYTRPTHLSSALADGLGSLGSSVVGAAAGVITTPIAIYKERKQQGLETRLGDVVGGVGMGLVGIVARPMGGVASLVSMATDGILYGSGMSDDRLLPFEDVAASRFDARPNEILRYKLKVLSDVVREVVYAHGIWVAPSKNLLVVEPNGLHYLPSLEQLQAEEGSDEDLMRKLLIDGDLDRDRELVLVTVLSSDRHLYIIGESGASKQVVLAKTPLADINAVEENLKEPSRIDLGIRTSTSIEWLRFRLLPNQRRRLSHQVRLWMSDAQF